ncbi:S-layer homology domain-containing protein, partial [Paenibacillus chitinolyticus]|uniref:S-layer homology domain-containing protein n=1 Tax=Paenibacillus chitinolyticus TaxID=79263 RepID=UPI002DB9FCF8
VNGFEDGTFRPDAPLSRQEAAITLSRILHLKENSVVTFTDQEQLPEWSRAYVGAAADARLIDGYQDGSFGPLNALTRAEAMQLLDRSFGYYGQWYGESGTYGNEQTREQKKGSIVINSPGVTLQNMEIAGDLIISKQVGDGDVFLKNVNVKGRTLIYGGGENSVHMEDSVLLTVIVNKKTGTVRLVAEGKTTIQEVTIQSATKVDSKDGADINKVTLSEELPEKSRVFLRGEFETVDVKAKSISVQVPSGTIKNLTTQPSASDISIDVNKEAKILEAILQAAAAIFGEGNIGKVTVNSKGISIAQTPEKIEVGSNVPKDTTIKVGGTDKQAGGNSEQPPILPGTGSGASNNSNNSNSNSGNNGSSTGNGGGNPGPVYPKENVMYDAGQWYSAGVEEAIIPVTKSVYATSPRKGMAYIGPHDFDYQNSVLLEEAVKAGVVNQFPINPLERTEIPTKNVATGFTYLFLQVIDEKGNFALRNFITILDDAPTKLIRKGFSQSEIWTGPDKWEGWSREFYFNREVSLIQGHDPRDYILVSTDSKTADFKPLDENFKVEIVKNKIIIRHTKSLGQYFYFKLLADLVETPDGLYKNENYEPPMFTARNEITLVDYPANGTRIKVPIGTMIRFKVKYDDDVYFLYEDARGTKDDLDKEVADGHGLHLSVPANGTDPIYEFDTTSLQASLYRIWALKGDSIVLELTNP